MKELRKQFKIDHPETIGETDSAFDDSNYIDWLESKVQTLTENNLVKQYTEADMDYAYDKGIKDANQRDLTGSLIEVINK